MKSAPEAPPPAHRLRIDAGALAHNWRALDALSGEAAAGAAVKANCYGLGADQCVPVLRDAGAEVFFVAHWSEVAGIIAHVSPEQVAVLHGPMTQQDVAYARSTGAIPVINSIEQAQRWNEHGGGPCHLMIDTGINRLGLPPGQLGEPAVQALRVDTLMSHLACADEDSAMNAQQLASFRAAIGMVGHERLSLANSAGIALGREFAFDLTRPGLALFGGVPRPELADTIRQVGHIEAAIIQVRDIKAGDSVGYNAQFTADRAMRVGTVALGYADGFLRARGKGCSFLNEDRELPLLGKVSMDMVVVDLAAAPDLREGDWLEVPFDLPDAARQSSVSQYELLTVLGQRLRGA
ncbi:alanine racemase [Erythrobacter sp. THAF29]|uniref:alanine racemase n=1 Tax=Erythrobacter sp. THAF29 TaxID=2587851 RepID=UPI0012683B16|nr:alanine racemase [Erythrobacter sp. THAF29]QFT77901.1 Alanine racemase, biosynthetic [Erythrobacter sp. THAF29]